MKKTFYFLTMLFALVLFTNCSNNDSSPTENNENYKRLIGKWYFDDPSTDSSFNNSFTFLLNGKVTYTFWTGIGKNYDSETGSFSVDGDVLKMTYPEGVTIIFVQKMIFLTNSKVQFVATGNSNEEPYDGTYYKAD